MQNDYTVENTLSFIVGWILLCAVFLLIGNSASQGTTVEYPSDYVNDMGSGKLGN